MTRNASPLSETAREHLRGYAGKRVLVTGHTGFKGSWLCHLLHRLGATVSGVALAPPSQPSHFALTSTKTLLANDLRADVRDTTLMQRTVALTEPDIVFHLAAAATVKEGIASPIATFETNVIGTLNVLEAIRHRGEPCRAVVVTSDKCYDNPEHAWGLRETDRMGGKDPYSASKGACELAVASWRQTYVPQTLKTKGPLQVVTARAGNVIGGGDWGDARLVPDIARAAASGDTITLRSPHAVRPWQHVLDPLTGYLQFGMAMCDEGAPVALNFGPAQHDEHTVQELCELIAPGLGVGLSIADSNPIAEVGSLRLDSTLARTTLDWSPRWSTREAAVRTAEWYANAARHPVGALSATTRDIDAYWGEFQAHDGRGDTTPAGREFVPALPLRAAS
ncbi:MAG: CDP-glucose 4,6-dehydratase [Bradymonadia bacterium]|jgi:CDP-glucose 4,6-dehydratase